MQNEAEKTNKVKVEINNEEYIIKGPETVEHIQLVASYVDEKIKQLSKAHPNLNTYRIAVLTALNITNEMLKLKQEYEEFLSLVDGEVKG
ncbi:MAG TPA: cell division protein ZapA [Thermoanaerobacterales bacterium]|jgi:cell division protein ZapA|nr:cell division protein ZapA [Thermoanaerobacterales bacterium]